MEIKADEAEQVIVNFKDAYRKFVDYIKFIETLPEEKRTMKQKSMNISK